VTEPVKNFPEIFLRLAGKLVRILLLAKRARPDKQWLPGVLAIAGTSVRAFRKPDTVGDHSFQDIRLDCSKGRKPHRFVECGRGPSACRMASILSETAGAREETQVLQRLNFTACIDG
jgi:hypothetical protein